MIRTIKFQEHTSHPAAGCVEVNAGNTKILCTASIINQHVPRFLRDQHHGWLTAEYSMLPAATHSRTDRDATKGKVSARSSEIQRLIGRALRSSVRLKQLPQMTLILDCDVIQADGSTRCHAINGAQIALVRALQRLQITKSLRKDPLKNLVAAVSAGIMDGQIVLDLDYQKDKNADADINIVMSEHGDLIEIQGTAENKPFSPAQLNLVLDKAWPAIESIIHMQKQLLEKPYPYTID
ncbi:ribonuclease PH [Candidatus Comchoanobacter bicostacola]|uniref:Ribonuclease PH n=1 Tax=Candidatus Comchoanobacter bicostacola TaxID=2919598 RepID=A0ABY5DKU5_9GAMM|nr:ribonuclease PH [Candidatus Comchoanobacter bicostacola]UTC24430.1 ribonuclease PH [Candidatus Comchoanobacter bicostacola]